MAFCHNWLLAARKHDPGRLELCPAVQKKGIGASLPSAAKVKVIGTPPPPLPPTNTYYLLAG